MIKYVDLKDVSTIIKQQNSDLLESYLRIHDAGFNARKNIASFSSSELSDFYKFINQIELSQIDTTGFILGYISDTGGLREQFDVLRFSEKCILNIELKSNMPKKGVEAIERQLCRHKLYLGVLNIENVHVYTYLASENRLYWLNEKNELASTNDFSNSEKLFQFTDFGNHELKTIDLSSMMVSPYAEPTKFFKHKYFLTETQYKVRDDIISYSGKNVLIKGGPGSGKTLVLMDLAQKYQSMGKRVLLIFCGILDEYEKISQEIGIHIVPIRKIDINKIMDRDEDVILVDESQRLYQNQVDSLMKVVEKIKIFSFDIQQTLHSEEKRISGNFFEMAKQSKQFLVTELKGRVRYDPELSSFIQKLIGNKSAKVTPYQYNKVELKYCGNKDSAKEYVKDCKMNQGFIAIEPTEYMTKSSYVLKREKISPYSQNVHNVVGREYDKVLVIFDDNYAYNDSGLIGTYGDYYPYLQVREIFEALTRVKRKLNILVVGNIDLYCYIQKILTWKDRVNYQQHMRETGHSKELEIINRILKSENSINISKTNDDLLEIIEKIQKMSNEHGLDSRAILSKVEAMMDNN